MDTNARATLAVSCIAAPAYGEVVCGIASTLPEPVEGALPESIQMFPPGRHAISATRTESGEPIRLDVDINAALAARIAADFEAMVAAHVKDEGPHPYFDFNHDDREASAWPKAVYWAGDHPKEGGIRAKVEWSTPGGQAVKGKAYRQFSPNFRVSKDTGEILGTTPNMGGLVNRPAFRKVQSLFAKHGGADNTPKSMNKLHEALIAAGLLSVMPTDETAALSDFNSRWQGVSAKVTRIPNLEKQVSDLNETVKAKDTALGQKDEVIKAKDAEIATANTRFAETTVAAAIADGILAPKDDAAKAKWLAVIAKDPTQADLLKTFNVSARAAGAGAGDPGKTVIKNGEGKEVTTDPGAGEPVHALTVLAKEIQARDKCDADTALSVAARENPKAYEAYRKGLMFVAQ